MKRTLSLVLALVMLLGTIPVFAADTAAEQAAFLEEMGVLKGNTAGDLMLAQELKREDSVVMLARLLGLEAAAEAWEGAPTWTDLPENPYYVSFLAWAQEAGYYQGHSNLRFGFGETISANDFALVLLRALGYAEVGDDSWETAFEDATELGLLEGLTVDKTGKLLRGDMAVMVYLALGTEMAEGGKTLAEELGVEMPVVAMEVEATGAKKLTVTFNKAVEGATFAINKGSIVVNFDSAVMAEDGKSAVITTTTNLTAGDYTVKVSGVAEEVLEATVTVTNERVATINLLSDKAPMTATGSAYATVGFEVLNQYGEKMTSFGTINWTASTGKLVNVGVGNVLTIESATANFIPGNVVYLTGVHAASGTVFNGSVEVVLPAQSNEVVFAGVYSVDDAKLAPLPAGFAAGKYYLLYQVKDQYGNVMSNPTFSQLVFTSSNPLFVDSTFVKPSTLTPAGSDTITISNVTYQAVALKPGGNVNAGGTVTVQAISNVTGKISTYTIEADALATLKSFTLSAPEKMVAGGETVVIPFVAVDQYGNQMTAFSKLNANSLLTLTPGLVFEEQNDGSAKLKYTTASNTNTTDALVYLTSVVTGGNFSNVMLTVKPNAVATSIIGLKPAVVTSVAEGNVLTVNNTDIVINDQYGRAMTSYPTLGVLVTTTDSAFTSSITSPLLATQSFTMTANVGGTATTQSVKFVLNGDTDETSAKTVTFTRVAQSAYVDFEVSDLGTMYVDGSGAATDVKYNKTVKVYGVLSNGTKVLLPSADYSVVLNNAKVTVSAAGVISNNGLLDADFGTGTNYADIKVSVLVTINERATGAALEIIEKELLISNKTPKATTVNLDTDVVEAGKAVINPTTAGAITYLNLTSVIDTVKDQYGVAYSENPTVTITNVAKVSGSTFTVTANGLNTAAISGVKLGDKFTATYKYASGVTATVEFTVGMAK